MKTKKKDTWISSQAVRAAKLCDGSWVAGFGLALSEVQQRCGQHTTIADVCNAAGLTMVDFKRSGLDEYDLKSLRQCLDPSMGRLPARRKHSRDGKTRCEICSPLRCSKAK